MLRTVFTRFLETFNALLVALVPSAAQRRLAFILLTAKFMVNK